MKNNEIIFWEKDLYIKKAAQYFERPLIMLMKILPNLNSIFWR